MRPAAEAAAVVHRLTGGHMCIDVPGCTRVQWAHDVVCQVGGGTRVHAGPVAHTGIALLSCFAAAACHLFLR
jgi:hypothetical protein